MRKTTRNISRSQRSRKIRRRKGGASVNNGWAKQLVLENRDYGMANECSVKDNGNKLICRSGGFMALYGSDPYYSRKEWDERTAELAAKGINLEQIKANYRMAR